MKKNELSDKEIYVRISPSDAVECKKNLLEITASIVNTQLISERFKELRKHEVIQKSSAKRALRIFSSSLNKISAELPKIKIPKPHEKREFIEEKEKLVPKPALAAIKKKTLSQELEEIRSKIKSLSLH